MSESPSGDSLVERYNETNMQCTLHQKINAKARYKATGGIHPAFTFKWYFTPLAYFYSQSVHQPTFSLVDYTLDIKYLREHVKQNQIFNGKN